MTAPTRSKGAIAFVATGLSQVELAEALGCSATACAYWQTGERLPGPRNRERIFGRFKIPPEAWDELPERPKVKRKPTASPPPPSEPSPPPSSPAPVTFGASAVAERAARMLRMVDKALDEAEAKDVTSLERARLMSRASAALATVARLTGEGQVIDEARLVRMPALRRVFERMAEALTPWPDALRAAGEELRALEDGAPPTAPRTLQ